MNLVDLLTILQDPIIPIPPPFELPPPGSGPLDVNAIWDYDNLYNAIRAFRTVFEFARQNSVMAVYMGVAVIAMAIHWLLTGGMDRPGPDVDNLDEAEAASFDEEAAQRRQDNLREETYKKMKWNW